MLYWRQTAEQRLHPTAAAQRPILLVTNVTGAAGEPEAFDGPRRELCGIVAALGAIRDRCICGLYVERRVRCRGLPTSGDGALPRLFGLVAIGQRLRLRLDENGIEYPGGLKVSSPRWQDIEAVTNVTRLPWPRARVFGPQKYELRTADVRFYVNRLYFSPEGARAFRRAIGRHRLREARQR